jgi:hypothetical protein
VERAHPGLLDECRQVFDAWTPEQHERIDTPASAAVTPRIIETQHLAGTPDQILVKLDQVAKLGIKTFATVTYTLLDKKGMLKAIGDQIIARVPGLM